MSGRGRRGTEKTCAARPPVLLLADLLFHRGSATASAAAYRLVGLLNRYEDASDGDLRRHLARRLLEAAGTAGLDPVSAADALHDLADAVLPDLGLMPWTPSVSKPRSPRDLLALESDLGGDRLELGVEGSAACLTRDLPLSDAPRIDPRVAEVLAAWSSGASGGVVRRFDPEAVADRVGDRVHVIAFEGEGPESYRYERQARDAGLRFGWRFTHVGSVPHEPMRRSLMRIPSPQERTSHPRVQPVRASAPGVEIDYLRVVLPLHGRARRMVGAAVAVIAI
jgi:hypothetical protein